MVRMKPEVARLWADALRSGRYPQTSGALMKADGYCCLGVLCELHRQETGEGEWEQSGNGNGFYYLDGDGVLADRVVAWAGMDQEDRNPAIEGVCLSVYNDVKKLTFDQIADLIEGDYGMEE